MARLGPTRVFQALRLLLLMNHDAWVAGAYGPLFGLHGRRTTPSCWRAQLTGAGFGVVEQGTSPGTAYFLAGR